MAAADTPPRQPRIPLELQKIFLDSARGKEINDAPSMAFKIFSRKRWFPVNNKAQEKSNDELPLKPIIRRCRVPLALQKVFISANRGQNVARAPDCAFQVFKTDDEKTSKKPRRPLLFGMSKLFMYDKKKAPNQRDSTTFEEAVETRWDSPAPIKQKIGRDSAPNQPPGRRQTAPPRMVKRQSSDSSLNLNSLSIIDVHKERSELEEFHNSFSDSDTDSLNSEELNELSIRTLLPLSEWDADFENWSVSSSEHSEHSEHSDSSESSESSEELEQGDFDPFFGKFCKQRKQSIPAEEWDDEDCATNDRAQNSELESDCDSLDRCDRDVRSVKFDVKDVDSGPDCKDELACDNSVESESDSGSYCDSDSDSDSDYLSSDDSYLYDSDSDLIDLRSLSELKQFADFKSQNDVITEPKSSSPSSPPASPPPSTCENGDDLSVLTPVRPVYSMPVNFQFRNKCSMSMDDDMETPCTDSDSTSSHQCVTPDLPPRRPARRPFNSENIPLIDLC